MVSLHHLTANLSLLCFVLYVSSIEHVRALQCYICHANDSDSCLNELRDCPTDQAYDRCRTTIYKNPLDGRHIRKDCALAPCHLVGVDFANFKSKCDESMEDCTFCCPKDGCNKDAATGLASIISLPLLCLMLAISVMARTLSR